MAGLNRATLLGNLGQHPAVRQTKSGSPVANLRLATNEKWRDRTTGEMRRQRSGTMLWHSVRLRKWWIVSCPKDRWSSSRVGYRPASGRIEAELIAILLRLLRRISRYWNPANAQRDRNRQSRLARCMNRRPTCRTALSRYSHSSEQRTEMTGAGNLTEEKALRAYAAMVNTGATQAFETLLADDFVYESQRVFAALTSKQQFVEYIRPKLRAVERSGRTAFAEMGVLNPDGRRQPCVVLAQDHVDNLIALIMAKVSEDKIKRIDLCIVPPPDSAQRSGEYPE